MILPWVGYFQNVSLFRNYFFRDYGVCTYLFTTYVCADAWVVDLVTGIILGVEFLFELYFFTILTKWINDAARDPM